MTRKSKREIASKLEELDSDGEEKEITELARQVLGEDDNVEPE